MQELFTKLFWENEEVSHAVACLCKDIPGYQSVQTEYEQLLSQVQEIIGYELCNQFLEQLTELDRYEEYAYYAIGLGLRETVFRELML